MCVFFSFPFSRFFPFLLNPSPFGSHFCLSAPPHHSLLWMILFKRRIRRSWIDFGLNIVRGPSRPLISSPLVSFVYILVYLLCPPRPPLNFPTPHSPAHIPSFLHSLSLGIAPRYQVLMYSHDVSRHVLPRVSCRCPVRNILT